MDFEKLLAAVAEILAARYGVSVTVKEREGER